MSTRPEGFLNLDKILLCIDLVDSTILLLAVWMMGIVNLDITRTTKQQQKYQNMIILNIADVMILTMCTKYSVMANLMSLQITMWCHTTNTFCTIMIATSMLSIVYQCRQSNIL